jgi:hypothetical protein
VVTAFPTAETLSDRLKKGPLPLQEAGPILHRIASAMDAIHSQQRRQPSRDQHRLLDVLRHVFLQLSFGFLSPNVVMLFCNGIG